MTVSEAREVGGGAVYYEVEYDASNAFGVPIRGDATCKADKRSGEFIEKSVGPKTLRRMIDDL